MKAPRLSWHRLRTGGSVTLEHAVDVMQYELACTALQCSGTHGLILMRQVLAEQRERWRLGAQVREQPFYGLFHGRHWPVIAYAVAEAVLLIEADLRRTSRVVLLPVARIGRHGSEHCFAQAGTTLRRQPLALERRQRPQGLTQREGQCRPDLEDGVVTLHERAQVRRSLVVRRMR